MRKALLFILVFAFISNVFSQEDDTPVFLVEVNSGYAIGVNIPNSMPIELKITYPFYRFGVTVEGGISLLSDKGTGYHVFLGPTFFVVNNPKIRVPISLGFDIMGNNKGQYLGAGGIISFNYSLSKNLYMGINLEVNYDFNHPYQEIVGYRDAAIGVDESGNKVYPMDSNGNLIKLAPINENKNHFGENINTLVIPRLCRGDYRSLTVTGI